MTRRMAIAALALVGIFVALYLTLYKLGVFGALQCGTGSCETVNTSRWATFLGLPVAAWGLGFYLVALAVALLGTTDRYFDSPGISRVLVGLSTVGVLFSAWLTYLEAFVIHAYCMWCLISAALVSTIFVASVADWWELRSALRGEPPAGAGERLTLREPGEVADARR